MASPSFAPPRTLSRPAGPRPRPGSPPLPSFAVVPSNAAFAEFGSPGEPGQSSILRGTLSRGTVLHKGFYDLLSMLPNTASQLRGWAKTEGVIDTETDVAGPRYEDIPSPPPAPSKPLPSIGPPPTASRTLLDKMSAMLPPIEPQTTRLAASISAYFVSPPSPTSPITPRRVSKDMISSPTGFR